MDIDAQLHWSISAPTAELGAHSNGTEVRVRDDKEIRDMDGRQSQERDAAPDAANDRAQWRWQIGTQIRSPVVYGARGPRIQHAQGQIVAASHLYASSELNLKRRIAIAIITDKLPVNIHLDGLPYSLEAQPNNAATPMVGDYYRPPVPGDPMMARARLLPGAGHLQ